MIFDTKRKLAAEFEMKDLGMMHYFLGMEVWQNADGISLRQGKYALDILKRFGMMDCKAMATPMASNLKLLSDASSKVVDAMMYCQMIGSLVYLTNMRPDICFFDDLKLFLYPNIYYKVEHGNPMILLLYVDDFFVTGMDGLIVDTKRKLTAKFEMKYLGMMTIF